MSDTAITQGAHHIGLTVPDLAATRAFFTDTLGFETVGEKQETGRAPALSYARGALRYVIENR